MLFNSYVFILVFLPVTLIGFFGLTRFGLIKESILWMAVTSLFFYGYWNPAYVPLLLISIVGNYLIGYAINRAELRSFRAKSLLLFGICFNLLILGYYKYARFIVVSLNQIFPLDWTEPNIILPLAISFYTFTQMAYLVDAYRGKIKNLNYNVITYGLFVIFFPQLIAGPILRHDELLPQLRDREKSIFIFSWENFARGLTLFILGLAKKVLIADNLSPWVSLVFNNASDVGFLEAWIGALAYTFQLYFDFSGYSDMAIGLGWIFNIDLPLNFNSPYKSTSIIEFWRRWHITLSNFLRDYLYISLGGNRKGEIRRYINLIITMLLGGLWHGAGWTFVLWGGMHGLFLAVNQAWRKLGISLPKIVAWMITFLAVVFSWVLFRASSISDAVEMFKAMTGIKPIEMPLDYQVFLGWLSLLGVKFEPWNNFTYLPEKLGTNYSLLILLGFILSVIWLPNTQQMMEMFKPRWWVAWLTSVLALFCLLSLNRVSEFLYFQF
jgi:alginate O-acetyltransferase complex protein AlgI